MCFYHHRHLGSGSLLCILTTRHRCCHNTTLSAVTRTYQAGVYYLMNLRRRSRGLVLAKLDTPQYEPHPVISDALGCIVTWESAMRSTGFFQIAASSGSELERKRLQGKSGFQQGEA